MGKGELVSLLSLSFWRLVIVVWLFLAMLWVCLAFVFVVLAFYDTVRVFRFGQNMLPARYLHTYMCIGLLHCNKYLSKECV